MARVYRNWIDEWRVIDGDTVKLTIDLGYGIYHKISLRLDGIDAPELHKNGHRVAARIVADAVNQWLSQGNGNLQVESRKIGKYGRVIGDIINEATAEFLVPWLLRTGRVKLMENGRRATWSDEELRVIERTKTDERKQ